MDVVSNMIYNISFLPNLTMHESLREYREQPQQNFYCPGPKCGKIVPGEEVSGPNYTHFGGADQRDLEPHYFHTVCGTELTPRG